MLQELEYHEAQKLEIRHKLSRANAEERAAYLVERMRRSFGDAEVAGWDGLVGTYGLPDPNDEHIVAAAVVAGAGAIVTSNVRDFPRALIPPHVQVLRPAEFAENTVAVDPLRARFAVNMIVRRYGRKGPAVGVDDFLNALVSNYRMTGAVELIRRA